MFDLAIHAVTSGPICPMLIPEFMRKTSHHGRIVRFCREGCVKVISAFSPDSLTGIYFPLRSLERKCDGGSLRKIRVDVTNSPEILKYF